MKQKDKDNRTDNYKSATDKSSRFNELCGIMAHLRGDQGCAWDKKQNISDIASFVFEEACEVIDAVHDNDMEALCEELGDLLLQIVFISRIAEEQNLFDISLVCKKICDKLVFRHPHIFGSKSDLTPDEVVKLWNVKKEEERKLKGPDKRGKTGIFTGTSLSQPALKLADRVQKKAALTGFDWDDIHGVKLKVYEELKELEEALEKDDKEHIDEEFGDLLFTLVNLSRFIKIDPELSLRKSSLKFMDRFLKVEELACKQGNNLNDMTLQEMDALWERIKRVPDKLKTEEKKET
jgi:tetrapyrrole methylase family protein/MazG family protein